MCLPLSSLACEEVAPVSAPRKDVFPALASAAADARRKNVWALFPLTFESFLTGAANVYVAAPFFCALPSKTTVRFFVNALCVTQADTSSFPFYSFSNLKDNNRQHHLPVRVGQIFGGENTGDICVPRPLKAG